MKRTKLQKKGYVWNEGIKTEMSELDFVQLYGRNGIIEYKDGTLGGNVRTRTEFGKYPSVCEGTIFFEKI